MGTSWREKQSAVKQRDKGRRKKGENENNDKRGEQKTEWERRQLHHKTRMDKTAPECATIPWPADPQIGEALLRSC